MRSRPTPWYRWPCTKLSKPFARSIVQSSSKTAASTSTNSTVFPDRLHEARRRTCAGLQAPVRGGGQLLWEVSTETDVDAGARHSARDLIVLRAGQYVFRQVIEQYLQRVSYDDEYARRLVLPRYEVAEIAADPAINFGKPYFAHTGTPLHVVHDLLRAGEPIDDVADDFDLPVDQVTEVAQRERLLAA